MADEMDVTQLVSIHEGWRGQIYCDACGRPLERDLHRPYIYTCSDSCRGGNLTIGYGTNLSAGLATAEGHYLLRARLQAADMDLDHFEWYVALNAPRQAALMDMRYTLGASRFRDFRELIGALARGDFPAAAAAVLDSYWARTEAHVRAAEDAQMIATGEWP